MINYTNTYNKRIKEHVHQNYSKVYRFNCILFRINVIAARVPCLSVFIKKINSIGTAIKWSHKFYQTVQDDILKMLTNKPVMIALFGRSLYQRSSNFTFI